MDKRSSSDDAQKIRCMEVLLSRGLAPSQTLIPGNIGSSIVALGPGPNYGP